ncbi:MAG: DUF4062 domain-containing protein [Elusimicrobia bacterium]|nr:DUF4062 domain-containing protein [Elusimicrobiota bacterium]
MSSPTASRTYRVGGSSITLTFDNILKSKAQVLVSSDDYMLSMGGGVSAALRIGAGDAFVAEAAKAVPARTGDLVVTSAGKLGARFVFHAITIGPRRLELDGGAIVRRVTRRAIGLLPQLGCRSIAFPAIGTGVAGIPFETAASEMAAALVSGLFESDPGTEAELFLGRAGADAGRFFSVFEEHVAKSLGLTTAARGEERSLEPPADVRRGQVFGMLRHLDARRLELEGKLLPFADSGDAKSSAGLRAQLKELVELRSGYEAELLTAGAQHRGRAESVFVSSTSMDLKPHRLGVRGVVEGLGLKFIGMEDFEASGLPPATLIRKKVVESDHYVGIIGMRYGYVEPSSGLSMTELEYRQAVSSAKPILLFVMDKNAPITAGMVETDPQGYAKLLDFRDRVLKAHTCGLFTGPEDLNQKVTHALKALGS